jgi:hypothetical protein
MHLFGLQGIPRRPAQLQTVESGVEYQTRMEATKGDVAVGPGLDIHQHSDNMHLDTEDSRRRHESDKGSKYSQYSTAYPEG